MSTEARALTRTDNRRTSSIERGMSNVSSTRSSASTSPHRARTSSASSSSSSSFVSTTSKSAEGHPCSINDLPNELLQQVFCDTSLGALGALASTSRRMQANVDTEFVWAHHLDKDHGLHAVPGQEKTTYRAVVARDEGAVLARKKRALQRQVGSVSAHLPGGFDRAMNTVGAAMTPAVMAGTFAVGLPALGAGALASTAAYFSTSAVPFLRPAAGWLAAGSFFGTFYPVAFVAIPAGIAAATAGAVVAPVAGLAAHVVQACQASRDQKRIVALQSEIDAAETDYARRFG